jgi:predicted DsbA family dithiol-disulfide isomerase
MSDPLVIDYYTDVLCVWAWIAQRRIDELEEQFGERVQIRPLYINLFGDTEQRMKDQWGERGGFDGFAKHVIEAAEPFDNAPVNSQLWQDVRPKTSANAHLVLKAIELHHGALASREFARKLRSQFFEHCVDIGDLQVLLDLLQAEGLSSDELCSDLYSGRAMAALMQDYQRAQAAGIKGSPSWVMDGGRQVLYGNVGYRVLSANVEELLRQPESEACWC